MLWNDKRTPSNVLTEHSTGEQTHWGAAHESMKRAAAGQIASPIQPTRWGSAHADMQARASASASSMANRPSGALAGHPAARSSRGESLTPKKSGLRKLAGKLGR